MPAKSPVFTCLVGATNDGMSQPHQLYIVTGSDLLFGLQPHEYLYPREVVYPYSIVSCSFGRDYFLHDPRLIAQQQVSMEMSQFQPSQHAHPSINRPIFFSPNDSSSFTQSTHSIGVPPLNRIHQPSYSPRVFPACVPKGLSDNFGSGSLLCGGPPTKPKLSGFDLWCCFGVCNWGSEDGSDEAESEDNVEQLHL